ncbi:nicotinate-nucleotide pyrophosphorylase [carboxylating] [Polynucleobacter meluiroseus]|uniref:nicotinate-nucleotide diphosphorylase (carboxylating) n=1 Tax=Polynucleobacter meluiroseus TaxID=1938814 RepID=A0A240E3D8_9BURK|nr:carboxylating nicotinate-nucleotide diphosphorylase [Polynucleobacter meluiroseus]SNX29390.1 nicotinate-nucleotide pyrophosphorylase [carboxylating] [Polynucleobacter meluiroseus]
MLEQNEILEQARQRNIDDALAEDIGTGDWTANLVPSKPVRAQLLVRQSAVLCGIAWFEETLKRLDPSAKITWHYAEGDLTQADTPVCDIEANSRALLSAERACINFLQTLSWTASITRQHVDAIAGVSPNPQGCAVLDTRKTIPGMRQAQKYAVRVGGGQNQRMALWHGILIKENHIAAAGSVTAAIKAAQGLNSGVTIQVEVETLAQLEEALAAGAVSILMDNFTIAQMREAVEINQGRALLEASGGIDLEQMRAIAATGVDRISLGKLTKDVHAVDFSLRIAA